MFRLIPPFLAICWLLLVFAAPAHAYIGPGLGLGTIGAILGVLLSVLLAIFAIFWYPIKKLFKRGSKPDPNAASQKEDETKE